MKTKQKYGAFSLVELLVVIAIVCVLAVLGMQIFGKMREQGQNVSCVQRLKTIGAALTAHAADYRGQYPPTAGFLKQQWIQAGWTEFLQERGYLERSAIAFCPALDREANQAVRLSDHHPAVAGKSFGHFSYGLRSDHPGKLPPPHPVWNGSWTNFTWNGAVNAPITMLLVPSPSTSIVATDSIAIYGEARVNSYRYDAQSSGWSGVDFRHSKRTNALFADGHVASLTREEMADFLEKEDGTAPFWNGHGFSPLR